MIALGNKIGRSLFVIALLGSIAAPACADVAVEFSDAVQKAVDPKTQQDIQDLVNAGLRKRAKESDAAKDLLDSGQTIKIVCHDEQKAKDEGIDLAPGLLPEFGKTKGSFDKDGKPNSKGTAYIAINCDYLSRFGWYTVIDAFGTKQSMWDVLVHELLHATNEARKHGDDGTDIYDRWVTDFNAQIGGELRKAEAKTTGKKIGAVPRMPTEMYAFVNNQPEVLACIAPGQNPQEAAKALGMGNHQFVAGGPGGTMIRGPGDAQTVNRLAQERKITLCFPAEANVCIIMTPLTPFRGHDHEAHQGAAHEHDAPDPPLDWGVTPPETAIRFSP